MAKRKGGISLMSSIVWCASSAFQEVPRTPEEEGTRTQEKTAKE